LPVEAVLVPEPEPAGRVADSMGAVDVTDGTGIVSSGAVPDSIQVVK